MTHRIAIFNAKGGVGKTSTAYNLAVGLARFHHQRVLVVDIDPQGHAGISLGIEIADLQQRIDQVLLTGLPIEDVISPTAFGVDVIPSNILLAETEIPLSGLPGRENLLRKAITPVQRKYDFILYDCPPNVGIFSVNALMAADWVLVPVDMSYLGLLGITVIDRMMNLIRTQLEHPINLLGVLATRYNGRLNIAKDALKQLQHSFGDQVFASIIPETVRIREAPSFQIPIFDHAPNTPGAKSYEQLTDEVMSRVES